MIHDRILVTSYTDPDLDGVSCMVGHSGIILPRRGGDHILYDKIILVDASETRHLAQGLEADNVVAIIDHRGSNDAHLFKNAKAQIELVGAAATLVAERLREKGAAPSKEAAILLYSAIVSNTLNFKASMTTSRDKEMAEWANQTARLDPDYPIEFFKGKSNLVGDRLRIQLDRDFGISDKNGKLIGISQIEMVGARELVKARAAEILETLDELARCEGTEITFLTIADVGEGINIFVTSNLDLNYRQACLTSTSITECRLYHHHLFSQYLLL